MVFSDMLAPFIFIFTVITLYKIITHSVNVGDEAFYLTIPHRLVLGDGLITDEWHVSQFSALLLYLPFKVYYSLKKSTDGIILYFRTLYAISQALVSAFLYVSFRVYAARKYENRRDRNFFSLFALAAATVFACFIPAAIPTLCYYSMSLMGLAVFSALIFCYRPNRALYFFAGTVFAATVLAQPLSALVYFILAAAAAAVKLTEIKLKKSTKPGQKLNRFFPYFTAGIVLPAVPVTLFLIIRSGIKGIIASVPHLFDGVEYNFSKAGNIIDFSLYKNAARLYGIGNAACLAALLVISVCLYKYRRHTRPFIITAASVMMISAYIHADIRAQADCSVKSLILYHGMPVYLSGAVFFFLTDKPDKALGGMWLTGEVFSAIFGLSSDIILGTGGIFAGAVSILLLAEAANDTLKEKTALNKALRLGGAVVSAALLLFVTVHEAGWFVGYTKHFMVENELEDYQMRGAPDTRIEAGPHKGIHTTAATAELYERMRHDIADIRANTKENGTFLVCNLAQWYYLDADLPYGTYSAWFNEMEFDRLENYWNEHPEKIPDIIYYPYYSTYTYKRIDKSIYNGWAEKIEKQFDGIYENGETGMIFRVSDGKE